MREMTFWVKFDGLFDIDIRDPNWEKRVKDIIKDDFPESLDISDIELI